MELIAVAGPAAEVSVEVKITIFDRHGEVSRRTRTYRANRGWPESTSDLEESLKALVVLLRADNTYADLALSEVRGLWVSGPTLMASGARSVLFQHRLPKSLLPGKRIGSHHRGGRRGVLPLEPKNAKVLLCLADCAACGRPDTTLTNQGWRQDVGAFFRAVLPRRSG